MFTKGLSNQKNLIVEAAFAVALSDSLFEQLVKAQFVLHELANSRGFPDSSHKHFALVIVKNVIVGVFSHQF